MKEVPQNIEIYTRNIQFFFFLMKERVSLFSETQTPYLPPSVSNTEILKCVSTVRASFTLQFSIHKMKRQALLKCLQKKYEQWFSGTKQIKLSDFILKTLSYLRNAWLTGHTNNQLQIPAEVIVECKGSASKKCQTAPAHLSHSGSSSCSLSQSFLPPSESFITLWFVSRSDYSIHQGSWMEKLIHCHLMAGLNHPLGFGHLAHTHGSKMPIIISLWGYLKQKHLRYLSTPTDLLI